MLKHIHTLAFLLITLLLTACSAWQSVSHPAPAIASAHPLATEAGIEVLRTGGNAFDAAVAVSAALAVVEPFASGIGGGGLWLLYRAGDGKSVMLDGREQAPGAAHRDMYRDAKGIIDPRLSVDGALAAAIPGEPAALAYLAEHYGRLPLSRTLVSAIRLAREGFPVSKHYQHQAAFRYRILQSSPTAAAVFLQQGQVPEFGYRIVQTALAETLEALARKGAAGFYRGAVAERLVAGVKAAGGIWTLADLANYRVVERSPLSGEYRGMKITTAASPSAGGTVLLETLNILEGFADLTEQTPVERKHLIVEAMRRAYKDRAEYLGDPDFVGVPSYLTDKQYAEQLRTTINPQQATPSAILDVLSPAKAAGHTSHLSILDAEGNRVAATLTINYPFGACYIPTGTGVLLNDEMDDFAAAPGIPNVYGLVGGEANSIAPRKRPLSSMTPTFLETPTRLAVIGTPGGSRISSMVILATLAFAEGREATAMVGLPRYHHQYLPDQIQYEAAALNDLEQAGLRRKGHVLKPVDEPYGNMQVIVWDKSNGAVTAASDPRGEGKAYVLHEN